ncbi:MAG: DUF1559 domain-containing protein [Planctomycetaceae bacterium]|nr:DUF1559 domain-containing protein [Planctomycetaceae bacterium]
MRALKLWPSSAPIPASFSRRKGLTIAELLVALGCCGLLLSLISPAILKARSAAQRLNCQNRLRQVGIALQGHAAAKQSFPRGGVWRSAERQLIAHAPHVHLLPYLGMSAEYADIDLNSPANRSGVSQVLTRGTKPRISVFLCPSDPSLMTDMRNSYRANIGVTVFPDLSNSSTIAHDPPLAGFGAFFPVHQDLSPADFLDGLSQTVGFSERVAGDGDDARFTPGPDINFHVDVGAVNAALRSPQVESLYLDLCANIPSPPLWHDSSAGRYWLFSGFLDTWYNHVLTPNHPIPDCANVTGVSGAGVIPARSAHPGGVNVLLMDGHVRFINNTVDARVWRALGTRDGYELDHQY